MHLTLEYAKKVVLSTRISHNFIKCVEYLVSTGITGTSTQSWPEGFANPYSSKVNDQFVSTAMRTGVLFSTDKLLKKKFNVFM